MESSQSANYTKSSHHFKFNYSLIKDLPADQFVSSPVFHASGHDWVIDCILQDFSHLDEWVGKCTYFLVRSQGVYKNVLPVITFYLMDGDGTAHPLPGQASKENWTVLHLFAVKKSPFQGQVVTCGLIPIGMLEHQFTNDGSFELICDIDNGNIHPDQSSFRVPKPLDLLSQIGNLLESQETADVTFDVGERSFMCHRAVLVARSPVLKAELFGSMAEAQQNVIKIKDMSPEVFEAMLHFMYTDSFPCCDSENTLTKMAQHLFEASDRYAIDGLKALCENHLCASISLDTVASTLVLAEQHNSSRLKNSCLEFLGEPGTLISWMLTDEYVDLVRSFPSIMAEIRAKADTYTIPSVRNIKKRKT